MPPFSTFVPTCRHAVALDRRSSRAYPVPVAKSVFPFPSFSSSSGGAESSSAAAGVAPAKPRRPRSILCTPSRFALPRTYSTSSRARPCRFPAGIEPPSQAAIDAPVELRPRPSISYFRSTSARFESMVSFPATSSFFPSLSPRKTRAAGVGTPPWSSGCAAGAPRGLLLCRPGCPRRAPRGRRAPLAAVLPCPTDALARSRQKRHATPPAMALVAMAWLRLL